MAELRDALIQLAMAMQCASNDFHCLHFNIHGEDFDNMHSHVLKSYYEEASMDFDEFCEKAQMVAKNYEEVIPNPSKAAEIAGYTIWEGFCTRKEAIARCDEVFSTILAAMTKVFLYCNEQEDAASIGVANYIAGRIEYWSKEQGFFNRFRNEER